MSNQVVDTTATIDTTGLASSANQATTNSVLGAKTDARDSHTDATALSIMQVLKELSFMLQNPAAVAAVVSGTVTANAGANLNTSGLALETGGNLATLAGIVSSGKGAVKAASGDFADGALATLGAKADARDTHTDATAITLMAVLKQISYMLQNPASTPVSQQTAGSVSGTLQSAQAGNATGTPLSVLGMSVAVLTVSMTGFTGTVNFEGQEDGANFGALNAVLIGTNTITSTAVGSNATSVARYEIPVAGLQQIQARTSGVTGGNVTVTAHAVPLPYNGKVINANMVSDSSGIKTDMDTLAGIVSANKAAVKTAAGDIADLSHGQGTMAASVPVAIASDQTPKTAGTATRSSVASAASDTSLLASNTSRKGATFYNDSTAILYLAYGSGAATTSSYTLQVPANGFFEMPPEPIYTGAIRGIWASANGNVRITELT